DINDTTKDLRNDVIVLGKRTGTKTGVGFTNNWTGEINPKNPTYTFRQSRAIDLNSIYSTSASNFVGRPMQTIIIDPSITNEEHADYVSYSFIQRYRNSGKEIKFKTIGNPLIELNDCIKVIDEYKDGITTSKKLWVTNIQDDFDGDAYLTEFTATDLIPQKSYFDKPEPDLELFDNNPFWNVRVYNGGVITTLENQMNVASSTAWVADSLEYSPPKGYLMVSNPNDTAFEVIKYSTVSSTGGTWYYSGLVRGLQRTNAATWAVSDNVIGAYDPYTGDSMGIVPRITFDLVKSGYLSVKMFAVDDNLESSEDDAIIDDYQSLSGVPIQLTCLTKSTNNDSEDDIDNWPFAGHQYTKWGKDRYFTWNGNDDISVWNNVIYFSNKAAVNKSLDGNLDQFLHILDQNTYLANEKYGRIEGGIYMIENIKNGYSKVFPYLELNTGHDLDPLYAYPTDMLDESNMTFGYIRRSIVSTVTFKIDYSSVFASGDNTIPFNGSTLEPILIDNSAADAPPYKYGYMVYVCTHTVGRGNRVNYEIIDETAKREYGDGDTDFAKRFCALQLTAHIHRITYGFPYGYFQLDENERVLEEDDEYNRLFYNMETDTGLLGRFNPKLYMTNFSFINPELWNSYNNYHRGVYWNTIFFTGQIKDKSGRICLQVTHDNDSNYSRRNPHSDFMKNNGLFEHTDQLVAEGTLRGNFIGWYDRNLAMQKFPGWVESDIWYNLMEGGSVIDGDILNRLDTLFYPRETIDYSYNIPSKYGALMIYMDNIS
ncbi:MAG: hypothetical protein ABIJ97_00505, partial [Bacteroidota bacterium]